MKNSPMRRPAASFFWGLMWIMLALGLVAAVLFWRVLKPDGSSWTAWALEIGVWAGAFGLCALLLRLISGATDLLWTLAAMWRPLVLVLAAAYLLFSNDQGRELGVGLLAENNGWRLFFLFLALIYWATNNWHTARLGLRAAVMHGDIPAPLGDDRWMFWPPRLLGVCAHLFAAINLSLAAQSEPALASGRLWLVAWTAPLVIVAATGLAWSFDRLVVSQRRPRERTTLSFITSAGVAILMFAGIPGFIAGIAKFITSLPPGFSWGTFWISSSAVVFLNVISWHRRRPIGVGFSKAERASNDKRENRQILLFTAGLFLIAVIFACATWTDAVSVGRTLGSMVVAYFALGAILALVNAVEFAVTWLTEKGVFGQGASIRVVGAYAAVFLIAIGVLNAWLHPFHRVRTCDGDCIATELPDDRLTVAVAARTWYEQAKAAYGRTHGEGPVPMVIVATAGGGIRAAYWTAEILEKLAGDFEDEDGFKEEGGVRPYLFAISGVSGGSVGATAFEAALAERDKRSCRVGVKDPTCPRATMFLTADFLAPALANLVFVDAPSSFLPHFGQVDRGTALERSFEYASGDLLARPFLSLFPYKKDSAAEGKTLWRPVLLLNATHEETGKRIITGHVLIERNVFIDSLDALHVLGKDVRASTAAHNSARFTYISPAGDLGDRRGSVIDGGYFENYGALTALELARAARSELRDEHPGVKLVILMISSDPGLEQAHELVRIKEAKDHRQCLVSIAEHEGAPSGASHKPDESPNYLSLNEEEVQNAWLNEFIAPFQGIKNVREAHGNRAAAELAVQICAEFRNRRSAPASAPPSTTSSLSPQVQTNAPLDKSKNESVNQSPHVEASPEDPYFAHLAMCTEGVPPPVQAPLGWVLSSATRTAFPELLRSQCENGTELEQLEIAIGKKDLSRQASGP
ncbi:hypothetical protein [Candidatus Phyllobacterium onerii]|uniref:hypothetical protein n=1 Tax=Candidatus Phyllobacterium onerii TaxID=3020828 RepID=UPI00233095B9|nr:hypothetical protein [Phyllobacterium sp. IY22]